MLSRAAFSPSERYGSSTSMLGPTCVSESKIKYPLRAIAVLRFSVLGLLLAFVVPAVGVGLLPGCGPRGIDAKVTHEGPRQLEVQRLPVEGHEIHLVGFVLQRIEGDLLALGSVD